MFQDVASKNCSPELLAKIADVVDSPIIITQKGEIGAYDHKIIYANKAFLEFTGYTQREVIGRSPDFLCDQRNDPDGMIEFYKNCHFSDGFELELESFCRDGSGYSTNLQVTPAGEGAGNSSNYIILFSDIDIEQELEAEFEEEEIEQPKAWQSVAAESVETVEVFQAVEVAEAKAKEEAEITEATENTENTGYDAILEEIAAEINNGKDVEEDAQEGDDEIDIDIFEDDDDLKEEYNLEEAPTAAATEDEAEEVVGNSTIPATDAEAFFAQLGEMLEDKIIEAQSEETVEDAIEENAENVAAAQNQEETEDKYADPELSSATGQIAELLRSIEKRKAEAEETNIEVQRIKEEGIDPEDVRKELSYYAKNRFMSNMSHDLRTPLNAIIGFSEVIRDQLFGPIDNPRYTSYANDIYKSGQELLATVAEILELSEIEEEDTSLEEEDFSLTGTLDEILDLLSARAFQCDVKILKKLHAGQINCNGDRKKIKQAFAGILSNAIKCSPTGGNLELHSEITEDGAFQLMVYIRSANMIAAKSNLGSLLGTVTSKIESEYPEIMIAHKFIEAHGGEFSIFNSATSGTEISMIIPKERVSRDTEKTSLKVVAK